MVIEIFLITLCLVLLIAFLWERRKWMQTRRALQKEADELKKTSYIAGAVLRSVHAFVLLIDSSFTVLNTNYYRRTGTRKGSAEKKVGDLLQCRNALSASGGCGTHELCGTCPVRCAIQSAFDKKANFTDLEVILNIYTSNYESVECETIVSGNYLLLNGEDRMVITVHDITRQKRAEHALQQLRSKENCPLKKN